MKRFISKLKPYGAKKESPLTDTSSFTVDSASPRNWLEEFQNLEQEGEGHAELVQDPIIAAETKAIEVQIANQIRQGKAEAVSTLKVDAVTYSLPDLVHRTLWRPWSSHLADNSLFQHAKILPHSMTIVQYYIETEAHSFNSLDQYSSNPNPRAIIVLNCDNILVECVPYTIWKTEAQTINVAECPTSLMMEMAG
jgi:hypothetical protein